MTLIGIGNPWKEVWKRADKAGSGASRATKDLMGVWAYAGAAGGDGKVPAKNVGFKFITGNRWCDTQADSKTGIVVAHHGGTWEFKGGKYVESVKYANPGTLPFIGHDFKFDLKVDGDTLTLAFARGAPGAARPTKFESPEGSEIMVMTLKRAKK